MKGFILSCFYLSLLLTCARCQCEFSFPLFFSLHFLTFIIGGLTASLQRQDPSTTTYAVYSILLFLFFFFPSVFLSSVESKTSTWQSQDIILNNPDSAHAIATPYITLTGINGYTSLFGMTLYSQSGNSYTFAVSNKVLLVTVLRLFLPPFVFTLLLVCLCFVNCDSGLVPQFQWPRSAAEHATLQPSNYCCILLWWVLPFIIHIYIYAFISLLHLN